MKLYGTNEKVKRISIKRRRMDGSVEKHTSGTGITHLCPDCGRISAGIRRGGRTTRNSFEEPTELRPRCVRMTLN